MANAANRQIEWDVAVLGTFVPLLRGRLLPSFDDSRIEGNGLRHKGSPQAARRTGRCGTRGLVAAACEDTSGAVAQGVHR
jgi:hypothetical protein